MSFLKNIFDKEQREKNRIEKKRRNLYLALKDGKKFVDFKMGSGYYLYIPSLPGYDTQIKQLEYKSNFIKGYKHNFKFESGEEAICELTDIEFFDDPPDMIKSSKWFLYSYVGQKPQEECTYDEWKDIYSSTYNFH